MTNKKLLWAYQHARRIQALVEKADLRVIETEGNLSNNPESKLGWKSLCGYDRSLFKSALRILSAIKI